MNSVTRKVNAVVVFLFGGWNLYCFTSARPCRDNRLCVTIWASDFDVVYNFSQLFLLREKSETNAKTKCSFEDDRTVAQGIGRFFYDARLTSQSLNTRLPVCHMRNQLPKILAIEKLEQRLGESLNPDYDVLFPFHLAGFQKCPGFPG
jgi:hypothetical protein